MKIGVVYPQIELRGDPDAVRTIGLATEALGYDHLVAYDHVVGAEHADRDPKLWGPYTEQDPFHDPFVMFAYLAAITQRIEFATGVLILPQRQTVLVAQQAADVDLLSGERFRLGVGSGWNYVEYDALGQDFRTRGKRLDEQIGFLRDLWREPLLSFEGQFDRIERGNINPRPKRSIPIWIGGFSEPAFRRGARLGDGFLYAGDLHTCIEARERVHALLREAGRGDEIGTYGEEYTALRAKSPKEHAEHLAQWEEAGGTHGCVVTMRLGLDSAEAHVDYLGQVKEALGR